MEWPGSYIEVKTPLEMDPNEIVAIEPRYDQGKALCNWPSSQIIEAVGGKLRILNDTSEPQTIHKHEHFCQVRHTTELIYNVSTSENRVMKEDASKSLTTTYYTDTVKIDPDNILPTNTRSKFQALLQQYDTVFDSNIVGYNGAVGPFEATVNMGPVQPPQRKGRCPQYARDKLVELQQKFDDLERQGIFRRPEDIGITAEYLNPSFLVKKTQGYRLVTAFADVGRYSKPQPSLMPDVDSTLRTIAQWKYIIVTDLTNAFYQIPLSKSSMKYCGVATPFRGIRVYTRSAMGMPGSETALED